MSSVREFKMFSKLLEREVDVEILIKFVFIEGCRYTTQEMIDMLDMEYNERLNVHTVRLLKLHGFGPEEV